MTHVKVQIQKTNNTEGQIYIWLQSTEDFQTIFLLDEADVARILEAQCRERVRMLASE